MTNEAFCKEGQKNSRRRILAMGAALATLAAPADIDSARFLSANAGATVDAAADYLLRANWKDELVGNAAGRAVAFDDRSAQGFVKLTADVTTADFAGFGKLVLVGDHVLTLAQGANDYTLFQLGFYYVDVAVGKGVGAQTYGSLEICGDLTSAGNLRMVANMALRADRYAKTADAVRVTPWKVGDLTQSNNHVWHYAPCGADAVTASWRQTAGSPYLFPVGATAALAVGAPVIGGGGIPSGTFLKRIFPDGSIELSQPVLETREANPVTFAAFEPDFTQVYATWRCIGANGRTGLVKHREQDAARLVFSGYSGTSVRGIAMPADADDLFPGTVVLSNACQLTSGGLFLGRCRVELPGTTFADGAGLPKVPFVAHYDAASASALVVPADVSATVNNFTNLVGTLVKEGAGTLTLNLENDCDRNTGTLEVKEGTLVLSTSTGDAFVRHITLAVGAVLKVPAGATLRCETLDGAAGAVVEGPGKISLGGLPRSVEGLSLTGGATLEFAGVRRDDFVYDLPAAGVAGDPALWLEISSGVTTDESGEHVLRWDDVRGGDRPHVYNRNEKLKPQLVKDEDGTAVSILLPCDATSASADDQAILMWSRPLGNIRAVFIVKGAYQGGGQFLGDLANGTWMRPATTGYKGYPLFDRGTKSLHPALANGRFYVNGERRSVDDGYAYPGGTTNGMALAAWKPQLAEFLTAGDAYADNFAYNAGLGRSGRQVLHAAIVYTNELTEAERLATERYLLDKYRLVDVQVLDPATLAGSVGALALDGEEGVELAIAAGGAAAVESVSGAGTLSKRGEGLLLVKDLVAPTADIAVSGGELVVCSRANDGSDLPGTPALHVDASLAASVTTNASGRVTKWADVRGEAVNVATNIPGTWGKATVVANAVGGRPAIDFPYGSYTAYQNASPDLRFDNLAALAFFRVMASADGRGVLLGCCDDVKYNENGYYGIHRQAREATKPYVYNATYRRPNWECSDYDHALICPGPGGTLFRQDGIETDISAALPAEGFQLVSCSMPEPINTSGFSQLKVADAGRSGAYTYGGVTIGESIIYTNTLSRGAVLAVEAYLNQKWFGRETPGYRPAQAGRLTVAPSARVTVTGGAPLAVRTLASEGAVDGAVTVEDGGTIEVVVAADGTPTPLGITGGLRLAGDGTLVLGGSVRRVAAGSHLLASDVTAAGTWTVALAQGLSSTRTFALRLAGGNLFLDVAAPGVMIIIR